MKIILKHLHHTPSDSLTATIEQQLKELGKTRQIDEARVVIERRLEASPPFSVSAHLVTPGPDVFAEAADHTLRAALQKTMDQLTENIGQRHLKSARRSRNNQKTSPPALRTAPSQRN
ncbi:MAG: HPF/RaiA family ribosome-associated protein [Terrimicrobiaceae bacterium]